jgi:hypothetical protein
MVGATAQTTKSKICPALFLRFLVLRLHLLVQEVYTSKCAAVVLCSHFITVQLLQMSNPP